jgi:hypothetical protein
LVGGLEPNLALLAIRRRAGIVTRARRKKSRKTRTGPLPVSQSRLGNLLMRGHPLSEAEEKARLLVAKMEKRLGGLVHRNTKTDRGAT